MAAEYSILVPQIVTPNAPATWPDATCPCNQGLIYKRSGGGVFLLASNAPNNGQCSCGCGCRQLWLTDYQVGVHLNAQIPEGGTVAEIIFALAVDGVIDPASIMRYTPTAAEISGNIGTDIIVSVPSLCGCESVAVVNAGTQPTEILNGALTFDYAGTRRIR